MTGRTILHYRVLEKLGEGGMGAVFKARDIRLDRLVAIKVLPAAKISDENLKQRLIREARAASTLNHPNIITIYEIETGEVDGQMVDFIVMEYVAGKTLEKLIATGGLPADKLLRYAVQIADALTAAHEMGIIHRDLKPSNIMVTESGLVKVLDFGLAKLAESQLGADADSTRTILAQTGKTTLMGTAAYMSPEQVEGHQTDSRSDIFSFGSTLYEMMTGQRAFQRQTITATVVAVLRDEPKSPSDSGQMLPPELHHLVSRCLRKDPSRRIQHMVDVKLELEELQAERAIGHTGSHPVRPLSAARNRWLLRSESVALGLLALAAAIYFIAKYNHKIPPEIKVIALTSYPGLQRFPTLSPDGREVAFSWERANQEHPGIYIKLVAGGEPLPLTNGHYGDLKPSWSPDGDHIAFVRGSSVLQISALGGPERKIIDLIDVMFGQQLAWTRDSSSLIVPNAKTDDDPYSLWIVGLHGGQAKQFTSPPDWMRGDADPAVSPDGSRVAFARWFTTSSADVFVVNADGRDLQRLSHDNAQVQGLAWTPDGKDVVFSSSRDGVYRLWRIPAAGRSGTEPRRIGDAGPNAVSPVICGGPPPRLVCARTIYDFDIGRIDLPSRPSAGQSGSDIISSTRNDDSPRFSPDGSKIAFVSDRSGNVEIWVANSDGSNPMQVTFLGGPSGSPHWSPDGRSIVFDSLVANNKDIFTIPVDGGYPRRITTDKSQDWRPSYSRDGKWIYFGSDRSHSQQIWKAPSAGGAPAQVTHGGGYEPLESLDGKILYYTKSKYRPGLWSIPASGGAEMLVLPAVSTGFWDVANHGIYFFDMARVSAGGIPLKLYTPQTHQTREIAKPFKASSSGTPGLSLTPDGRSALYVRGERAGSELLMLENFR